jgi:hypothetical protein
MPTWLRKFTFNKLKEHYSEIEEAANQNNDGIDMANPTGAKAKIPKYAMEGAKKPPVNPTAAKKPTYMTTKAPKR